jgi:RNA polymerase sigma factor (sigma-70 family)
MPPMDDVELLWEYARNGSHQAFARVADRYLGLIHAAALRQVRDPHLAADVSQAVLIILMTKAGTISRGTVLPAWLLKVTRCAALDAMKLQARRRRHEEAAALLKGGEAAPGAPEAQATWENIAPLLDKGLLALRKPDREALVLRYLCGMTTDQIAWELGVSEDAARQRVSRALRRLRAFFNRRGVTTLEATLAPMLLANAVAPAPPALASAAQALANPATAATAASATAASIARAAMTSLTRAAVTSAALSAVSISAVFAVVGVVGLTVKNLYGPRPNVPVQVQTTPGPRRPPMTPLIQAAQRNDPNTVAQLLSAGAAVNDISNDGNDTTALLYALHHGKDTAYPTVQRLIDAGADVNARHGQWGYTALMLAVRHKSPKTIELLLSKGADPKLTSHSGQSALDWAKQDNDPRILETLHKAGVLTP